MFHTYDIILEIWEELYMNKTYSMSIRVSEEELGKLKKAAQIENYSSYSEFIRRTALLEAEKIINEHKFGNDLNDK
jgi:uncharacterized protein (DUF1778 family)